MKKLAAVVVIIHVVSSVVQAVCMPHSERKFAGRFEIVEIKEAKMTCDDQAKGSQFDPVVIKKKGRVISLKLRKQTSGKKADSMNVLVNYSIYETGDLCRQQVSDLIELKLRDISSECCFKFGEVGQNRYAYKTCRTTPNVEHLSEPPEEYIRCNLLDVGWEVVKDGSKR
ncbi:hypothetical protein ACLSU7_00170 [Bdellovibrio sp. HCB185ZH]|uniref:hypothetical protein n=1 Tax=Bdellovibrio sp. HCB185ZH TaxID=3394235 RepID=UPI0039A6FDD7